LSRFVGDRARVAEEASDVIAKRLKSYGLEQCIVSVPGPGRLVVQIPGADSQSVAELKKLIQQGGNLTFCLLAGPEHQSPDKQGEYEKAEQRYLDADRAWVEKKLASPALTEARPRPPEYIVRSEVERVKVAENREELRAKPGGKRTLESFHGEYNKEAERWESRAIVRARLLSHVGPTLDANTLRPAVHFELKGEDATAFADLTGASAGRALCIVLDDDILQVATIKEKITGRGQITGHFTDDDVRGMVAILRSANLPAKPVLISEATVGPGQGKAAEK
jgi:protein-export membrane protein SecD